MRGRVVSKGAPIARATVDFPPDHGAYVNAVDPFDVVSVEAVTGRDGRFDLTLPPEGATAVRVRTDRMTARRPLAFGRATVIDVGDIELPSAIVVAVNYAGDQRCVLFAVGPFGSSGVSTVESTSAAPGVRQLLLPEPGRWVIAAKCGSREVPVAPGILEVPPDVSEWSAHVTLSPR